jgi:hypothetical protein
MDPTTPSDHAEWIREYEHHESDFRAALLPRQRERKEREMTWKDTGKGDFKQPPEDTHVAICIRIIDLGTQDESYQGKPKRVEQVMLGWELPNALMDDGRPFMVSRIYTKSLNEKANLRSDLENWRGRDFTDEEANGFDERKLLGKACFLQVKMNDKGKAKVAAIAKLPNGTPVPTPVNELMHFSLEPDLFSQAVFDKLTDWTKEKIRKSPEWKALQQRPGGPAERAPFGSGEAAVEF